MTALLRRTTIALALALRAGSAAAQAIPFTTAATPWDSEQLGNHRAVVRVGADVRFARAELPWRRPDRHPELKAVLVVSERDGTPIRNVRRGNITQEKGVIDFEPAAGAGRYF
ncbi:MAG: hypothetical protein HY275_18875, partial [Gemmatimonadetes bacterium]|nr:hypothetical protein [Gemmatimonadota bacterium]